MHNPGDKFWIVLVNKSPQGPYTQKQVEELLSKNSIRRSEVAMLVSPDGAKKLSDWKMLWQFPEFDRRKNKSSAGQNPGGKERRRSLSQQEIKKATQAKVPSHLMDIDPVELLLGLDASEPLSGESASEMEEDEGNTGSFDFSWVPRAAAVLVVFLGAGLLFSWAASYNNLGKKPTARPKIRAVQPVAKKPSPSRTPLQGIRSQRLPAQKLRQNNYRPPPPPPKDFGRISESEMEELEDDFEEERPVRRKKKRKKAPKKAVIADEEEEFFEDEEEEFYDEEEGEEEVFEEEEDF